MHKKRHRVTIQNIADQANVSISTVSRVLSGNARVAEDKRNAVMQAVDALNYRPNMFARQLATGRSMFIGVLTQNFGSAFFDGISRGIMRGLEDTRYTPLFADGRWRPDIEEEALESLRAQHVDGIILLGPQIETEQLVRLQQRQPVMIVARSVQDLERYCVTVDNFEAGRRATQFLLDYGHRDIAHISGSLSESAIVQDAAQRYAGYQAALRGAGIEPSPELLVEGNFRSQSGLLAVESLLMRRRPFSAIFVGNDQMAAGVRLALYRRGLRVPDDVSLIGFDDQPQAAYMIPPLTTMRQPAEAMGEAAARALLQQLRGEPFELPRFSAKLVIRETVKRVL